VADPQSHCADLKWPAMTGRHHAPATAPQRYTGSDLWISAGSGAHPHGRIIEIVVTDIIQAPRTYLCVDLLSSRKRRGYHLAVQHAHAGPRRHQRVTTQPPAEPGTQNRTIYVWQPMRTAHASAAPSRRYVPSRGVADLRSLSLIILVMAARCKEAR